NNKLRWLRNMSWRVSQYYYAVLVHARDIALMDENGQRELGGAYAWRYVSAKDETDAAKLAIASLRTTPAFVNEVEDLDGALTHVVVEEIKVLTTKPANHGTAVVFYMERDD